MKDFPGAARRVFIQVESGTKMHLRKYEKVSTGPVTCCGRLGGWTVGWSSAKRHEICKVCARVAALDHVLLEESE